MPDFFVSYTGVDQQWAEWVAFVLEEKGFTTVLQAWDFRPGSNFILEMQTASSTAKRTIMVLSSDYLDSKFASPEWASAFRDDPMGIREKLVPVMVRPCDPTGLLATIVQIRLINLDEATAAERLLAGVDQARAKPSKRPAFPGMKESEAPEFPGSADQAGKISKVSAALGSWPKESPPVLPTAIAEPRNNLPARPNLVGRQHEENQVLEGLASTDPIILIDGIGGIGKTALALNVAHRCLAASSNSQSEQSVGRFTNFVWTSAKDREIRLEEILDTIARTLGVPELTQRPIDERVELIRHLLADEPCLLILDNFEVVNDDRIRTFLETFPARSKALITSRTRELDEARPLSISGLGSEAAVALIRREAQRRGLGSIAKADEGKLRPLAEVTGGVPLAIRWAVGQIQRKGQPLAKVIDTFHLATGDLFEEVFEHSWLLLRQSSRQLLKIMPIFAGAVSRDAIEAVTLLQSGDLDEALGLLVSMCLIEVTDELDDHRRYYSIHPLTRAFAQAHLRAEPALELESRHRAAAWFANWAMEREDKFAWHVHVDLEEQLPNVMASARWSHEAELGMRTLEYHRALYYFLGVRGHWSERLELDLLAVEVARNRGDHLKLAWALVDLSWIKIRRNELSEARRFATDALNVAKEADDAMAALTAKRRLSEVDEKERKYSDAERQLQEALFLNERIGEPRKRQNQIRIRQGLGNICYLMNRLEDARSHLESVVGVAEEEGAHNWQALILSGLANIARDQGRYIDAAQLYEDSLALWQQVGQVAELAQTKYEFSRLLVLSGDMEPATQLLKEALTFFQRLGSTREIKDVEFLLTKIIA
jgi:tetratricopeptide (TPR) repeat protein